MKRSVVVALVGLLLVTALACGPLSSGRGSSSSGVDITITNRSPDDICYVLISPSSDEGWGEDQLGDDTVIAPGESQVFNMDDDTYDVQVETCNEEVMATAWEVDRDQTVTVGDRNADVRLVLVNGSNVEICYVLISPSSGDDWGEDWMGGMESVMPNGARIFYVEPDVYDLQALDCDEDVLVEEYEIDITDDLTWTVGD
jgi:hypothetical protein